MDFSWSSEQQALRDKLIAYVAAELVDDVSELDAACEFSAANWAKLADFGVLGFALPEKHGGSGFDILTCLLYTSPSPRDATLSRMPSSA